MKKCKNCKQVFDQVNFNQKYCLNKDCVQIWLKSEHEKQWIKKKVKMKAELITLSDHLKITQQIFKNAPYQNITILLRYLVTL